MIKEYNILSNDMEFTGVNSAFDTYIYVSKHWDIKQVKLTLPYRYSKFLDKNLSYFVVKVNDLPIKSIKLSEISDTGLLDINLTSLKSNFNKITIDMYTRVLGNTLCEDYYINSNWVVLEKNAKIIADYTKTKFLTILDFLEYSENLDKKVPVFLRDTTQSEFSFNTFKGKTVEFFDKSTQFSNYIYISRYDTLSDFFKNKLKKPDKNSAIIKLTTDENGNEVLLIIANNEDGFNKANSIFSTFDKNLLDTDEILLDQVIATENLIKITNVLTQNGAYMEGVRKHSEHFYVNYPPNRVIASGSSIELYIRYSENLDFEQSSMKVFVNDTPIGSNKLSLNNANGEHVKIDIPSNVNISGGIGVRVDFDLHVNTDLCSTAPNLTPYAYIDNTSVINIRSHSVDNEDLKYFPYPFIEDYKLMDTTIIIPNNSSLEFLSSVYNLFSRYNLQNDGGITILEEKNIDNIDKNSHILVIGSSNNNSFLNQMLLKNKILYSENVASFVQNPFNKNKSMLLIASQTQDNLSNFIDVLSNNENRHLLNGKTFHYENNDAIINNVLLQQTQTQSTSDTNFFPLFITVIVSFALLLSITFYKLYNTFKKGDDNEK